MYLKSFPRNGGDTIKTEEGRLWKGMVSRCKSNRPTYADCSMSQNFKDFQYFAEWCQHQIGFNSIDAEGFKFQLDKDIIFKHNKIYSENNCVFVPRALNSAFCKSDKTRGDCVIGVSICPRNGTFRATCSDPFTNKKIFLGRHGKETDAFHAYKIYKETKLKELALYYSGKLDERVINALLNYQVEITD